MFNMIQCLCLFSVLLGLFLAIASSADSFVARSVQHQIPFPVAKSLVWHLVFLFHRFPRLFPSKRKKWGCVSTHYRVMLVGRPCIPLYSLKELRKTNKTSYLALALHLYLMFYRPCWLKHRYQVRVTAFLRKIILDEHDRFDSNLPYNLYDYCSHFHALIQLIAFMRSAPSPTPCHKPCRRQCQNQSCTKELGTPQSQNGRGVNLGTQALWHEAKHLLPRRVRVVCQTEPLDHLSLQDEMHPCW